jgi:cellulose biosynthesis protein BcsQ
VPAQAGHEQAGHDRAESGQAKPGQVQPGQPEPDQIPGDLPDGLAAAAPPAAAADGPPPRTARPVVTVTGDTTSERPLRVVERALRSQPGRRQDGWRDRVVVVPGGHRPGKPDQMQRDRARARLAVHGHRRIMVLGCTRGAGQTVTALLVGDTLARLRNEPVAVLDLNRGKGSLADRAAAIPGLLSGPPPGGSAASPDLTDAARPGNGLQVIDGSAATAADDAGRLIDLVAGRYPLTLADPAASCVPRALAAADVLLIVAPASAEAVSALGMTFEWLEAHGHGGLAETAITVLNGVSTASRSHVEHAATVASGRCRAVVSIPWDSRLNRLSPPDMDDVSPAGPADLGTEQGRAHAPQSEAPAHPAFLAAPAAPAGPVALSPALVHAYTALAGVLIAGLADPENGRSVRA